MEHHVSYHQSCPICGRNLQIGVTLLGKRVYCQHCGGAFIATEAFPSRAASAAEHRTRDQLEMVDALIERAEVVLGRSDTPPAATVNLRQK